MPRLIVRPAVGADLPVVLELLSEGARWSRDQGLGRLWQVPYPPEWVLPSLQRGEVRIAESGGRPVGTLTFRLDDVDTWGERPPDAGYVHKLAVARSVKGQGVGARLLEWAGDSCAKADRPWLRLDCLRENGGLRRYYGTLGFREVGEATVGDRRVTLLERPAVGARSGNIK